jgi:YVTN family beta-propeller protein
LHIDLTAARARAVATVAVGGEPVAIAAGDGAVWVSSAATDTVVKIDPRTNAAVASIAVGAHPGALAVSRGAVWVANTLDGTVSRIDPTRAAVAATIPVGRSLDALAADGAHVWAGSLANPTLVRIDPATNVVARRIDLGSPVAALAATARDIAAATVAAPTAGRGGTLRLSGREEDDLPITLDPATWWTGTGFSILAATNDGLVTYRRAAGAAGLAVVPDLARSLPLVGDGGTRYTFQLRRGLRYSTGRPVRASDVRASIERLWRMRSPLLERSWDMRSPAVDALATLGLVGETACRSNRSRCDLSRGSSSTTARAWSRSG